MRVGLSVKIQGRVQGVFFRAWTREQAERLGVTGWIRNCPDGSVEAHVEGDQRTVEQMLALLHEGPPGAKVDELRSTDADATGAEHFEVRH